MLPALILHRRAIYYGWSRNQTPNLKMLQLRVQGQDVDWLAPEINLNRRAVDRFMLKKFKIRVKMVDDIVDHASRSPKKSRKTIHADLTIMQAL